MADHTFLAVDGEAAEDVYWLLAASDGTHLIDWNGIGSIQAFEFLLSLRKPNQTTCCFGLNYDANQWFRSLPKQRLIELWVQGTCYWQGYRLQWIPSKWVSITHRDKRHIRICESFGFFQTSFVKACEDWGLELPPSVTAMKMQRSRFSKAEEGDIISYCHTECTALVALMDKLKEATDGAQCTPSSQFWIGAGGLAGVLMKKRHVRPHHRYDDQVNPDAMEAIRCAYFGGRVELLSQGVFAQVRTADIRSAYPWAAAKLPSLSGARLEPVPSYEAHHCNAIWRVRWHNQQGIIMPFPVRKAKNIWYPRTGEGYYHAAEVRAAIAAGFDIEVLDGWLLHVANDTKPFGWIVSDYARRRQWQREGNPAQKALKLAMNSIYGKLAQGHGGAGRQPPWQSYIWAGEITAQCRARLLRAACKAYRPILLATDGIFYQDAADVVRDTEVLGGWETGGWDEFFAVQPGVYAGRRGDTYYVKSRGFYPKDVDFRQVRAGWDRAGCDYVHEYETRRFVGLGVALARKQFSAWRTWPAELRQLGLQAERKESVAGAMLPSHQSFGPSEPYTPKKGKEPADDNQVAKDQPLRDDA